jgi:hypothetical protein
MPTTIQLKRSAVKGNRPETNELVAGELAINTHDGIVFFEQDRNGTVSIKELENSTAAENVFYVSKSGSDSNDGTSLAKAFATIDKALAVAGTRRSDASLDSDGAEGSVFEAQTREDLAKYISNSVYDITLGTRFNQAFQGRAGSYTQGFEEVVSAINKTKLEIAALSNVSADSDALVASNLYFDTVKDIVENGKDEAPTLDNTAYPLPVAAYYRPVGGQTSSEIRSDAEKAREILVANKVFISEEVNFFAKLNYPDVTYDEAKCKRDIRYAIEAIIYDAVYLGNSGVYQNADFFHYDDVAQIPSDQTAITVAAYDRLQTVISSVLNQQTITPRSGDTLGESYSIGQDTTTSSPPTTAKIVAVAAGAETIKNVIQNGTSSLPSRQNPDDAGSVVDFGQIAAGLRTAQTAIETNQNTVINTVVDFIDEEFPLLFYNIGDRYLDVLDAPEIASTIYVKTGEYTINNPVTIPKNVSLVGDNLKNTSIRPLNPTSDFFYLNNNAYVSDFTFRDGLQPAAVFAWDPAGDSESNVIVNSPYIRNCTTITGPSKERNFDGSWKYPKSGDASQPADGGDGIRNDGNHAGGIRSMVVDSFTQITQGGKGIYLKNRGYCQLVSVFTVYCDVGFLAENGGFASITNSNSSFGNIGLKATGVSPALYRANIDGDQNTTDNLITLKNLTQRPNISDAIKFDSDTNYFTVDSASWDSNAGTATIKLLETPTINFSDSSGVTFHQRSALSSSGHTFEWIGTGTDIRTAFPYRGGIPVQADEVVQDADRGGLCFVTSTDQKGDFRVGEGFLIQRSTGTIEGEAFDRSLFARVTPFSLALED